MSEDVQTSSNTPPADSRGTRITCLVGFFVVLCSPLLLFGGMWFIFDDKDACLDAGGFWNHEANCCEAPRTKISCSCTTITKTIVSEYYIPDFDDDTSSSWFQVSPEAIAALRDFERYKTTVTKTPMPDAAAMDAYILAVIEEFETKTKHRIRPSPNTKMMNSHLWQSLPSDSTNPSKNQRIIKKRDETTDTDTAI